MAQQALGSIRLGNKRAGAEAKPQPGEIVIEFDRSNPILGNPHRLRDHRNDDERARVIQAFTRDYNADIAVHGPMSRATDDLVDRIIHGERLIGMCWCAGKPVNKPCHGEPIIAEVDRRLGIRGYFRCAA